MPGQRRDARAAIHVAAGHAARAGRVPVLEYRHRLAGLITARRRFIAVRAFHVVPAVVHTLSQAVARRRDIDFLPGFLTNIGDVEIASRAIEREAPRIAQSVRPDLRAERVVAGDRVTARHIDVEPQQLAEQGAGILRVLIRIPSATAIAGPGVQFSIRSELELPAVVVAVGRMGNRDDRIRRRLICNVGIRGNVVADDADVAVRVVEIDVEPPVGRILRMKCDAEEPPLAASGERGLLSIAFHPQYATNGRFYVYFNNPNGDIRIVRYNVSTNADVADESSADTVIAIPHPTYSNHNGGQLQFGADGKLYAGTGDGGGTGDPNENAQNTSALLGKLLRLDVDVASGHAIPGDNPFGSEVWAYGLRNPWRFSFDRTTGDLYIADVGQGAWEEIDVAPAGNGLGKGVNYGWDDMEGTHCYEPATGCNQSGKTMPVLEYGHTAGACSVTGGYVYRGTR